MNGRIYTWSYTESGDVIVTEKDAREHMGPGDTELTEEHWRRAARYLTPESLEDCLDLENWDRPGTRSGSTDADQGAKIADGPEAPVAGGEG